MKKVKNESFLGPIAFDLCGPRGAGQAIGALSQNWVSLFLLKICSGCLLALFSLPMTVGPPIAGLIYDKVREKITKHHQTIALQSHTYLLCFVAYHLLSDLFLGGFVYSSLLSRGSPTNRWLSAHDRSKVNCLVFLRRVINI